MRKYFYILLALVVFVSVYTVACKNKPTAMAEFITLDESITNGGTTNGTTNNQSQPKDDGLLKNYVGTYQSKSTYFEGNRVPPTPYAFKAVIGTDGTDMKIYKGDTLYTILKRDSNKDNGESKALYDWAYHYVTFGSGVINLTFNGWTQPVVLIKQ